MSAWLPLAPDALADRLAAWLAAEPGVRRIAVDGPPCAAPDAFAATLVEPLRTLSRPSAHVRATSFWRDASLRFEHGREDVAAYRSWTDTAALRREVLDAAVSSATYLPTLRDPRTNRSTRAVPLPVPDSLVLLVSGSFLLGHGLPFEHTIHLSQSPATRARRTPSGDQWTLPAFDAYDREVRPAEIAEVVVSLDDPRHPAMRWT